EAAREVGNPGRGQDSDRIDVRACRQRPGHERAFEHGSRQTGVTADHEAHLGHAVVLEQGRDELAAEPEGQLGRERLLVRDAADAVRAEEATHDELRPLDGGAGVRTTRILGGLMRSTVTPAGTCTCSGTSRSTSSPGPAPDRLTRALTWSGPSRARVPRRPCSCTSIVSGRSLATTSPAANPSNSTGAERIRSDFSDVITKNQSAT